MSSQYKVGDVIHVQSPFGWRDINVSAYTIEKITPSGQINASAGARKIRVNASGNVLGGRPGERIVSEEQAAEIRLDMAEREIFRKVEVEAKKIDRAASNRDADAVRSAIEAITKALGQ